MDRASTVRAVLAVVVGIMLVTLILQNTGEVEVRLLFWSITGPLVILEVLTGILGFALGAFFGREVLTRRR